MPTAFRKSGIIYGALAAALAVSLALSFWLSNNPPAQILATTSVVGTVAASLFQIFRDQWMHDRDVALAELQNRFAMGATSHMAIVAFDKFVAVRHILRKYKKP
jgi:hypothetical protein